MTLTLDKLSKKKFISHFIVVCNKLIKYSCFLLFVAPTNKPVLLLLLLKSSYLENCSSDFVGRCFLSWRTCKPIKIYCLQSYF